MTRSAPAGRVRGLLASNEAGLVLVIVLAVVLFASLTQGFTSPFNLYAMSRVLGINIVIGFAMMVVIVTGGLNLAVGSIGVASVMFGGWLMETVGLPWPLGVLGILLMGAALGSINGVATVRIGVHSFIVTLATMSIYFGAMIVLTQAEAFRNLPAALMALGKLRYFTWISVLLLLALGVGVVLAYLFRLTSLGRQILAVGANARAALISGVPVGRSIVVAHALSGLLGALAGIMVTWRNGAALPNMAGQIGQDWLLPAFLAPVLGGTLLTGGVISVSGTVLGATLVTILANGLLLLQIGEFWVQACMGLILLAAVTFDRARAVLTARSGHRG